MDPTICLKLLIEKRREFNLETRLLFIDYEKTFDNTQRQILFNILKSRHIVKNNSGYLHTKGNIDDV
jgi:predicted phosphoadenosine phosphosulfate sulfurtransferase